MGLSEFLNWLYLENKQRTTKELPMNFDKEENNIQKKTVLAELPRSEKRR